jgi:hypothetical protein
MGAKYQGAYRQYGLNVGFCREFVADRQTARASDDPRSTHVLEHAPARLTVIRAGSWSFFEALMGAQVQRNDF